MRLKKNICIITTSLGEGGAQKVAATQSVMLSKLGFNVFVVSYLDKIEFEFSGELLNLEKVQSKNSSVFQRIERAKILKKWLKAKKIDLIIDHRSRLDLIGELFLRYFIAIKYKTVYVIHSRNLPKSIKNIMFSRLIYWKSEIMVSVSKNIKVEAERIYGVNEVTVIHNSYPRNIELLKYEPVKTGRYILFFGRLEENSKNLTFLIKAYQKSILPKENIKLIILGDGPDKEEYLKLVKKLNLNRMVVFKGHTINPFPIVRNAIFTVLTSNFEGFPLSLIESLACETPVVSVDCDSGPREIVVNNYNGLLVPRELAEFTVALNEMIMNKELLLHCKSNCLKSIEHLSFNAIKEEWREFIIKVLSVKKN